MAGKAEFVGSSYVSRTRAVRSFGMRGRVSAAIACGVCVAACIWAVGTAALAAAPGMVVAVTVTRYGATLSRFDVSTGSVVFAVMNKDTRPHTFSTRGSSVRVSAGESVRLEVSFPRPGDFVFVSAAAGRSRFRGELQVFRPCPDPVRSTVMVRLAQGNGGLSISQTMIPCGQVSFVVSDTGTLQDSLQVFSEGPGPHATTPELTPGQTATVTVAFPYEVLAHVQSGDYPPAEPEYMGDFHEEAQLTIN